MTDRPLTDDELREIREQIETIREATERLEDLGGDVPAVERNAARIRGTLGMLDVAVPPELLGGDQNSNRSSDPGSDSD